MDTLANNPYSLLFIDDEATGGCVVHNKQLANGGQLKAKSKKNMNDKTKKSNELSQQAKGKAKADSRAIAEEKLARNKLQNNDFVNKQQNVYTIKTNMQQQQPTQMQQQLQPQQQQEQHQSLSLSPSPSADQQRPQAFKDRSYREPGFVPGRVITNSNRASYGAANRFNRPRFDRHSGSDKTGIKPVAKRNGGGAHNWGKDIEDVCTAMKAISLSDDAPRETDSLSEDRTKYITIEEWRSKHTQRTKPTYNLRRAGEGETGRPDWKQMVALQKKKPTNNGESGAEFEGPMYTQRGGRSQRVLNIEFKFKDDRRRNNQLGGWSAYSRSKSEPENTSDPINVADELEFPTLGCM